MNFLGACVSAAIFVVTISYLFASVNCLLEILSTYPAQNLANPFVFCLDITRNTCDGEVIASLRRMFLCCACIYFCDVATLPNHIAKVLSLYSARVMD
jgi:hypothetical protein